MTAEINAILAAEFCQALLAPVVAAYQDEKGQDIGELVFGFQMGRVEKKGLGKDGR